MSASYGLQAGAQPFGYALFFIDNDDLNYLKKSDGWEIGFGPSIVIVDEGTARSLATTTAKNGVYAFIFQQKGLMGGHRYPGQQDHPDYAWSIRVRKGCIYHAVAAVISGSSKLVRPEAVL